jgi:FkbM family methyltransferase
LTSREAVRHHTGGSSVAPGIPARLVAMTGDPIDGGPQWRPGRLDKLRALARRALLGTLGDRGDERLHEAYHRVLRRIGRFGPPEDDATVALLSAIAVRSRTIIDVGANVGRYAWFLRRRARPDARLFALEPHPDAARLLQVAVGALPGSTVLELGASDRDGSAGLVVPDGAFGSPVHGLAWVRAPVDNDPTGAIEIDLRRLDGLIADGIVTVVGPVFLKIDVEGGEGRVLRGAAGLLRRHRPIIYFECQAGPLARQGQTPEEVWRELVQAGYRLFASGVAGLVPMHAVNPQVVNYLGIPDTDGPEREEPLDAAATGAMLDAWAARTSRV